jgi:hypothetical protein
MRTVGIIVRTPEPGARVDVEQAADRIVVIAHHLIVLSYHAANLSPRRIGDERELLRR